MSYTTPLRQRTASENEVRDRSGRSTHSSGITTPPRSTQGSSNSSSSKQMYTTEFIKALFGEAGIVVGDFSCSYQRQAGRLYVSTDAVFFYSNLFGFEKRIKIDYVNAMEIDLVRTTSVFIKTSEEEFIFRSFDDRQSVLELIKTFHSKNTPSPTSTEPSADVPSAIHSDETKRDDLASLSDHDENDIKQQESPEDIRIQTPKAGSIVPNSLDGTLLWEQMKKHSKDWDSIMTSQKLPYNSVTDFFDTFLRDSSPRSMCYFQSKVMGDSNVSLEAWTKNAAPDGEQSAADSLSRAIEFEHTTRWAVAKVKRRQTYQTCGKHAIIQNFTHLQGIPQADAFFVEDMWLLETETNHVTLDVKCRIVWLKNTMLKSVIEKRTKSEAKEWFDKYIPFVCQQSDQPPIPAQQEEVTKETSQIIRILLSIVNFARFIYGLCRESPVCAPLLALAIYTYHLKQRIVLLEELVDEVQLKMIQQLESLSVDEIGT
mmetsp:Transcript_7426/g.10824  ORF Transcript_7426/g.10824 Transcript_7426/m.10824 type:complete len:485 (-) Transcript_7426:906-2360(-)